MTPDEKNTNWTYRKRPGRIKYVSETYSGRRENVLITFSERRGLIVEDVQDVKITELDVRSDEMITI